MEKITIIIEIAPLKTTAVLKNYTDLTLCFFSKHFYT